MGFGMSPKRLGNRQGVMTLPRPPPTHNHTNLINFDGFTFTYRDGHFDWRLVHGIDLDAVIRLTDVRAIEDCLHNLQHGDLGGDRGLSVKNCVHLFRLLQLAIEYVSHLRVAHAALLGSYQAAAAAAEEWVHATTTYLNAGDVFIGECLALSALSKARLGEVEAARAAAEEHDLQYHHALDQLEMDDQQARYFHFRKQRAELSWRHVHAVDLEELVANVDTELLESVMHNLTFGSILGEDHEELTPHHFTQLVPLAQCALDYALFQANATGTLLEAGMSRLHTACADIPALTSAKEAMNERITGLIAEARSIQQQQQQQGGGAGVAAAGPGWPQPQQQGTNILSLQSRPQSAFGPRDPFATSPPAFISAPVPVPSSATGATNMVRLYDDMLTAAGGSDLLPAVEMQSRTAELHVKVDDLEKDLRMERYKTDEMRRILSDIRGRLHGGGGAGGAPSSPPPPHAQASAESLLGMRHSSLSELGGTGRSGHGGGEFVSSFVTGNAAAATAIMMSQTQTSGREVDEGAVRAEERRKTLAMLQAQIEAVKAEAQKQVGTTTRQRRSTSGAAGAAAGVTSVSSSAALPSSSGSAATAGMARARSVRISPTEPATAAERLRQGFSLSRVASDARTASASGASDGSCAERPGGGAAGGGARAGRPPRAGVRRTSRPGHRVSGSAGSVAEVDALLATAAFALNVQSAQQQQQQQQQQPMQLPSNDAEGAAYMRAALASSMQGRPFARPGPGGKQAAPRSEGPLTKGLSSLSRVTQPEAGASGKPHERVQFTEDALPT